MKTLYAYIQEMDGCATPGNTMGMGNPMPADIGVQGTEPLVGKKKKKCCKKVKESLLDDLDTIDSNISDNIVKDIAKYIKQNYYPCKTTISDEPSADGKYIINVHSGLAAKVNIKNLTNGHFKFGTVDKGFDISNCYQLKSLEGAPREVYGLWISEHAGIDSLVGAPDYVGSSVYLSGCLNLTSLEGCPGEIHGLLQLDGCNNLDIDAKYLPHKMVGGHLVLTDTKYDIKNNGKIDSKLKNWMSKSGCEFIRTSKNKI
jgi:hypothetical protein